MSFQTFSLHQLGWRFNHAHHLTLADFEAGYPARVIAVHRSGLTVFSSRGRGVVELSHHLAGTGITVGDWVMVEHDVDQVMLVIQRQSLITCVASRSEHRRRPVAANLDALFIIASCADEAYPTRLKRYLALALEANVEPVVVLTKRDLATDADGSAERVQNMLPMVSVLAVDAADAASVAQLAPWLEVGRTVALVGSSDAGKSTLARALKGEADVRDDDAGAACDMFPSMAGAWVIDTPDTRELRIVRVSNAGKSREFSNGASLQQAS